MRTVKIHTGSGWEDAQLGTREEIKALGFKYGDNLGFCRLEGKGWNHALLFCGKTPTGVKWYAADNEMVAFLDGLSPEVREQYRRARRFVLYGYINS